jgi:energy-coupling factor transport system substrate-specific component
MQFKKLFKNKYISTVILMLIGILLNYAGSRCASALKLPLWFDAFGTCITAGFLGPVFGAVCGAVGNIFLGLSHPVSYLYAVTNVVIGIVVGCLVKRSWMDSLFHALSLGVIISLISVFVSVPLNCLFYDGYCSNMWGDGLYEMLLHYNCNFVIAAIIGEIYVDFPDKVLTVFLTYLIMNNLWMRENFLIVDIKIKKSDDKKIIAGFLILLLIGNLSASVNLAKADISTENLSNTNILKESDATLDSEEEEDSTWYITTIYNSDNGLTGGAANDIAETEDGYIWVGTYAGLYRYDGKEFFGMDELESVKNVNCLYVDNDGRLWIGTNDNGVSIYVNGEVTDIINLTNGLTSNSVRCINEDSYGNYYIGTSDTMCIIQNNDGFKVTSVIPEITYVSDIATSDDGETAIVTNAGNLFLLQNGEIINTFYPNEGDDYYTCCEFFSSGELLVGTSGYIVNVMTLEDGKKIKSRNLDTGELKNINDIKKDESNNIWISADNGVGYRNQTGSFKSFSVSGYNSSVDHVMVDYFGDVWFTSSRMGLLKLCESKFIDVYTQSGVEEAVVNSVTMWNGYCYSGTDDGLDIINLNKHKEITNELTERLSGVRVRSLYVDSKNHLWICTTDGEGLMEVDSDLNITLYNTESGTIGNRFRSVLELSDGTIVIAENTGIDFIKDGVVEYTLSEEDGLSTPQTLSLLEMPDGTLMAGTDGDGIALINDGKIIGKIGVENGLTSGVILRIVAVADGYICVTSNSLCYIDKENNVTQLNSFPYSNNYDIINSTDGKLWILSSAGIYVVDEESLIANKELPYELLDSRQGLSEPLTANAWDYMDEDGNLYLSCTTGVYMVNTKKYSLYSKEYLMMVEYLQADSVTYSIDTESSLKIEDDVKRIVIKPVIFNFTLNDPYVRYYLEGFDEQPIVVRQSTLGEISYTNLSHGEYTFHLEILDSNGEEVLQSCTYKIVIEKQIWDYGWFKAYIVFVSIMIITYLTWLITKLHSGHIIEKKNHEIFIAKKQLEMGRQTIQAIAMTVDAKDENTSQHSFRVAAYSYRIAERAGWSKDRCENLRQIALLHDIGKIGIPDSVLNKPAKLTDEEYKIMKSHVTIGAQILKDFTLIENATDGALYHHERYDGKGYVYGLKGDEIPENARVIGIADAFDAMTSRRVYRKPMDKEYVLNELRNGSGTQFDPHYLKILLELIEDGTIEIANWS